MNDARLEPAAIDIGDFLDRVSGARWRLLVLLIAGILLGFGWHAVSRPVYETVTVLAPVEGEMMAGLPGLPGGGELSRLMGVGAQPMVSRKDEAVATLLSRDFLYGFIRELELLEPLTSPGPVGQFRQRLGAAAEPRISDAYARLIGEVLGVREDRRTGLLEIRVRWHDPDATQRWAEELTSRLNRQLQQRAKQRAEADLRFLQDELRRTETLEIRQAIFRLIETQLKTVMMASISDDFALRVIDSPVLPDSDRPVSLGLLPRLVITVTLLLGLGLTVLLFRTIRGTVAA